MNGDVFSRQVFMQTGDVANFFQEQDIFLHLIDGDVNGRVRETAHDLVERSINTEGTILLR